MRLGLPWLSFWQWAPPVQLEQLGDILDILKQEGAIIVNGTEIPSRNLTIQEGGFWDWNMGVTLRGRANESELTVVVVDFYNNIRDYLSELTNTPHKLLDDIIQYNFANDGSEGGTPGLAPPFSSGQDTFLLSLETKGNQNETYFQALNFIHTQAREKGIDGALHNIGHPVDVLLAPPDVGASYQISAQAGYPVVTVRGGVDNTPEGSGMPFGLSILGTAWSEGKLITAASAIEDALDTRGIKRPLPEYRDYLTQIVPVPF